MIQRIQTLYLLFAVVASAVSLCFPIGMLGIEGRSVATMYNLWLQTANGGHDFTPWALFVIQLLTLPIGLAAIFLYRNRKLQSRLCMFNILLLAGYYVVYAVLAFTLKAKYQADFSVCIQTVLPAVALIFDYLGRRAVLSDEKMVRAADRIR